VTSEVVMNRKGGRVPQSLPASEFKARCLEVMDRVAVTGEPVVVTKRGKPVVRVLPASRPRKTLRGFLEGRVRSVGDIVAPVGVDWEADPS
jgi:prevent-host-death family protein